MTSRIYLPALGLVNALGDSVDSVADGLFRGDTTGLVLEDGWIPGRPARIGRARAVDLPAIPEALAAWDCRNNRLLLQALAQIAPAVDEAAARYGSPRIGVVLGTSTSGVAEGEAALAHHRAHASLPRGYAYTQQEIGMPGPFLARCLGLGGPALTVSTACTSSAKAFASARRLLRHGLCDAVLVGGVDSLCRLTVNGFTSLESTSPDVCNPMSRHRRGINIGEGAALFLMTREPAPVELLGIGESSDAHHISAPHPEGLGAEQAMRAALADARLPPAAVGYLNLHATATPKNDQMESLAVARVFADGVRAGGTKPLTGHTLGAAGATELAFCWLAVTRGLFPPHVWDGQPDPELAPLHLAGPGERFAPGAQRIAMSNSFAFGGSNASLLVGLCPER
ncbi:beta-ketoacyl-[acyl-carrier-protein] synthase II [Paracidovorax avenae]|uniref:beta-ketoacyl-[acyl-carrier-protein] synthase family protein n=1 Tax=Paracidovorax avenae TaxID=80867 RepID=UPI000D1797DD|nr:beta-ketoacyl-[acyl-carrier-protein] synthase family protein [Paracidovorax avenae]AVS87849.1 beta-ketoacyl-[acyl-carrier-protein] synthase II [Paracidovorax avenae]